MSLAVRAVAAAQRVVGDSAFAVAWWLRDMTAAVQRGDLAAAACWPGWRTGERCAGTPAHAEALRRPAQGR